MTADDLTPPGIVEEPKELASLRAESDRLREAVSALGGEVEDAFREIAAINQKRAHVEAEAREAAAVLAAIRASNTWRALDVLRRARARAQLIAFDGRNLVRGAGRAGGVPAAVCRAAVGVNVAGYVGAESGLGQAVRASIRTLAHAGVPFGACANAATWGGPKVRAARYAELAGSWRRAGATIIGGCCGTTVEHLRAAGKLSGGA